MLIRIGTRGSKLALIQTELVKKQLLKIVPELRIEIISIKTTGDIIADKSLTEIGGKALFVKEIEEALIKNEIDIAVHSMKDMPAYFPDQLTVNCVLEREDPRDAFLSNICSNIASLPKGAVVGTSSPRRTAQLLHIRPDVQVVLFRGNVDTRLQKLESKTVEATIMAVAGLKRCQVSSEKYSVIDYNEILPAVAQGAIGVECRKDNSKMLALLTQINHLPTYVTISAERGFLDGMNANCKTPVAAYARLVGDQVHLKCLVALPDGSKIFRAEKLGKVENAYQLGLEAAKELKRYDSFANS